MVTMSQDTPPVVVVGAGPVGCVLATCLARRGRRVRVFEQRADPRAGTAGWGAEGRSINLVVTGRGFAALERFGLADALRAISVPIRGRMVHKADGSTAYQPYGIGHEANYSISRGEMNKELMTLAEEAGVEIAFGASYDAKASAPLAGRHVVITADGSRVEVPAKTYVFAADGAGSRVRAALAAECARGEGGEVTFKARKEPLGHGYKEVLFPLGRDGAPTMRSDALHIWPRGHHMLMALANLDGSFTGTVYLPEEGKDSFDECAQAGELGSKDFFSTHYPDATPLLDDEMLDVLLPAERGGGALGMLGTMRVSTFAPAPRLALIGDAAHAIVPFFGQGCNCCFEDCATLDAAIEAAGGAATDAKLDVAVAAWARERKVNADAIADMALENFEEMRSKVGDAAFLRKKALEHAVEEAMPEMMRSRYAMVASSTISYATCFQAGLAIEGILAELAASMEDDAPAEAFDRPLARRLIAERLTPILHGAGVSDLSFGSGGAKRKVGILGYGHLGQHLYGAIQDGAPGTEGLEVAFVWNRSADKLESLPEALRLTGDASVCVREAQARGVGVVVEVAHPSISVALAAPLLRSGVDFVCGSPTALADSKAEASMREATKGVQSGGLYIPSGAFWGAQDVQALSNRGGLAELVVTMKKHPSSFRLNDATLDAKRETATKEGSGETLLYEGPVRGLCPLAPNNVNTMACAALAAAGLGFDGVTGRLVADPSLVTHEIEIETRGPTRPDGSRFSCVTKRSSPAPPGAVTSKATYGSFLESLVRARGRGAGVHFV